MQRSLGVLVVLLIVPLTLLACGGGTDKPPLTPDDPTAGMALDAGDVPSMPASDPAAAPTPPK